MGLCPGPITAFPGWSIFIHFTSLLPKSRGLVSQVNKGQHGVFCLAWSCKSTSRRAMVGVWWQRRNAGKKTGRNYKGAESIRTQFAEIRVICIERHILQTFNFGGKSWEKIKPCGNILCWCFLNKVFHLLTLKYDVLILVYSLETFYFHDISYLDPHLNHSLQKDRNPKKTSYLKHLKQTDAFFFCASIYKILYFSSLICIQTTSQTLQPHPEQNFLSSHRPFYFSETIWSAGTWTSCIIPL